MGFIGFLFFALGVFGSTSGSKCVPEIAECRRYRVNMEPYKNLMESEKELNSWCRKQRLFYSCLENALLGNDKLSDLPTNLLISKMFSDDLCTEDSLGRKRYLNNAACINQLNTEYCTLPEYLDIVTPSDSIPSRCSMPEKTFTCIAATIVSNCGFDAGRVYRYLLKLTTYTREMCDIDSPDSVPPCEDIKSADSEREEGLSEIFYSLVHRFGIIPEEVPEQDLSDFSTEAVEPPVTLMDESLISEAIINALDTIDGDSSPEQYETTLKSIQSENLYLDTVDTVHYNGESEDQSYKKTPIITEPFKGLLHYNYSGQEYAFYWQQPDGLQVEKVECVHLLPSFLKGVVFQCVLYRRLHDPECVASVKSEQVTPELIRDIDPDVPHDSVVDFGPRPYWMAELDEYKRQKELREQSNVDKFSASMSSGESTIGSVAESPTFPAACTSDTLLRELSQNPNLWWKCHNVFSEELRKEIASVLLSNFTEEDIPLVSVFHANNIAYVYFYEDGLNDYESVKCARVNECHPRGKGVFKCYVKPREIKQCRYCNEETETLSPAFDNLRKTKTAPSDSNLLEDIDSSTGESSGDSPYETSEKLITLLLTTDETSVSDKADNIYTEDIVAEEDEIVAIDVSTDTPEPSQKNASSGFSFMILDQGVNLLGDESEIVSDIVNEADGLMDDKESDAS